MQTPSKPTMIVSLAVLLITGGCDENRRLAELAQRELEHRAAETQQLAEMHGKVQEERLELGRGRDELEQDRRQLATQRHRDPIIAEAITSAVWLLVCALPLLVCWRLLQPPDPSEVEDVVGEILITGLTAAEPLLLPRDRRALPRASCDEASG